MIAENADFLCLSASFINPDNTSGCDYGEDQSRGVGGVMVDGLFGDGRLCSRGDILARA